MYIFHFSHFFKIKQIRLIQEYVNGIPFEKTDSQYEMSQITGTNLFMIIKKNGIVANNCCKVSKYNNRLLKFNLRKLVFPYAKIVILT